MGEGKHDCNPSGTAAILQGRRGAESTSREDVGDGGCFFFSSKSASDLLINLFFCERLQRGFPVSRRSEIHFLSVSPSVRPGWVGWGAVSPMMDLRKS